MVRVINRFPQVKRKVAEVPFNWEELSIRFRKHDKNGDGKLSRNEVKAAFQELKAVWPWLNTEQAFRLADNNGDQCINIGDQEFDHLIDYVLKCRFTNK